MGLGSEGGEAATFIDQHVRAYLSLRKPLRRKDGRLAPKFSAQGGIQQILVRYLDAARHFFAPDRMSALSIAVDGSRVGGKDVFLIAIFGTDRDGVSKAAWGPPQVGTISLEQLNPGL